MQKPCPSVHTFVKDVSTATGRNDFIFDTWLWHSDLYRVSTFQAYRTSTSCLPRDLEFFMFAVMNTFVKRYLSFYWKKRFYIWYVALAWWLVPCLPFPGLLHIYFLFTVWLRIVHVCGHNENFRNRYLSFYWKIWYMALAWWLVPCLPFPVTTFFSLWLHKSLLCTFQPVYNDLCRSRCFRLICDPFSGNECWDIYKFDTNERVGVFLARRSVQHLVDICFLF